MAQQTEQFKPSSLYGVFGLMALGFVIVLARLTYIQGFEHEVWLNHAQRAQEKKVTIEAERGTIYDRNGKILAMNLDRPSVYAIPNKIKNPRALSRKLAPILKMTQERLLKKLQKKSSFVWLKRKIEPEIMKKISPLKKQNIHSIMESKRIYPRGTLLGQVMGFSGLDNQGLEGIERKHDATLRGREGAIIIERDAMGQSVFPKDLQYIEPSPGRDLHLTIDERIQYISERELGHMVQKTGAKGGVAIVMNPWNGEILAMAIQPEFDPNKKRTLKTLPSQWRNRAISDFYEPGSTFKVVTAAAALEEDLVTPDVLIDCEEGAYRIKGTVVHDHDPFGLIPFSQVIAHSSNIGTIKVAEILGEDRLASYVEKFGFGKRLGIAMTGESPGLVRKLKNWSGRSLASISIGQEIGVTPLQMVSAMSVLANGGYLMTPQIIREVIDRSGGKLTAARIKRRVLSEKTTQEMTEILKLVVSSEGTALRASVPGYSIAGKTGTAQKIDPQTGRYHPDKFISSFVGFAPAEDPVVTILVMVDEPEGKGWGGEVAAPVFASIAKDTLYHLRVPPRKKPVRPYGANQVAANPQALLQISEIEEVPVSDAYYEIGPSR